jgi:AcrR family transcriptional regulator
MSRKQDTERPKPIEGRLAEIAAAARELIAERGFEGLRTRDIAARVGINVATLHYHVPTKEALIRIVAQSLRADFIAQSQARPRVGLSPVEVLKLEFADFRETMVEAPERYVVMAELSDRAERDEAVAAEIRPMQAFWREMTAGIVADGRDQGLFRADVDPEAAAMMVIGTMSMSFWYARDDLQFFDRACAELLRALLVRPPKD